MSVNRNPPALQSELAHFTESVDFKLPLGFIDFYSTTDGVEIQTDEFYVMILRIGQLFKLNSDYSISEYAPDFFLFGSDGGDTAFVFNKESGKIYEMPFIGMSEEEALYRCDSIDEFILSFK